MSEAIELNGVKYYPEEFIQEIRDLSEYGDSIDIQQEMIEKWLKEEQEFKQRKLFADDIGWFMRYLEFEKVAEATVSELHTKLLKLKEEEEEKEKKKQEDKPGFGLNMIPNDRLTKINSCIELLPKCNLESDVNAVEVLNEMVSEKKHDMKTHLEYIIVQIQVELEKIKRLVCRENPNYKQAGNLLMPVYEILFQRTLKHDILTNVNYDENFIDKLDEFDPDADPEIVDLTIDENWKDK
jgi:hypothetical protein